MTTANRSNAAAIFGAILSASLTCWIHPAAAASATVSATLSPAEIVVGQSAQLTVTCNVQDQGYPQITGVPGLNFQHVSQASQIQIINGAMSANVTHVYLVTAERPGTYTIPPIKVGASESHALTLHVHAGAPSAGGPGGQSSPQAMPQPGQAPGAGGPDTRGAIDASSIGFLRMEAPKDSFIVGETVPVQLRAYFREGVELRVDGPPKFNSDAFTMKNLTDQPTKHMELVNGVPHTILTWPTTITAVKAGSHEMALEIPTTVTIRTQARRPSSRRRGLFDDFFSNDPFGDPFFDRFFGTATQKAFALRSESIPANVSPPPSEGRPDGFGGAVGRFAITATAVPTRVNVGDPITVKVSITGEGNFDRVSIDGIPRDETWKSYKPTVTFESGKDALSGAKTFELALVPLKGGRLEIPSVSFSFYDPDRKAYGIVSTQPIAIDVAGDASPPPAVAPVPRPLQSQPPPAVSADGLLPDKVETGPTTSLRPWFLNRDGLAVALAPTLLAIILWWALRQLRRWQNDVGRKVEAETRRQVREQFAIMKAAAERGAAPEFFAAARDAFRHHFAARWGMPAGAITLAELDARGNGEISNVRQIFELADEAIFAGRTFSPEMLSDWLHTVDAELKRLEATR